MKTAISIPNPIFEAAESLALQLGISRSELFTKAMADYIEAQKYKDVTAQLNSVYAQDISTLPNELANMQYQSIGHEDWLNNEAW